MSSFEFFFSWCRGDVNHIESIEGFQMEKLDNHCDKKMSVAENSSISPLQCLQE